MIAQKRKRKMCQMSVTRIFGLFSLNIIEYYLLFRSMQYNRREKFRNEEDIGDGIL